MSIRTMLDTKYWDESKQQWVDGAPKTVGEAVLLNNGNTAQAEFDAIPAAINAAVSTATNEVKGGVASDGDTLSKLNAKIAAINTLLQSDDTTLDELQEVVEFIKKNRGDLEALGLSKIDVDDIINALDTASTTEGKVLDARQGKVLKDSIDAINAALPSKMNKIAAATGGKVVGTNADGSVSESNIAVSDIATKNEVAAATVAARPLVSDTAPSNPVDGQIWFKPAGALNE